MYKQIATIPFEGIQVPVYVTDEYARFKFDPANRPVRDPKDGSINLHAAQIKDSIQKNGLLFSPVICNEKMDVIDGQHRVVALQELSLPVYFAMIPGYGGTQIQVLNEFSKNWNKIDFAHYFAKKNKPDYKRFLKLYDEVRGFTPGTLSTLMSNAASRKPAVFNSGNWQIAPHLTDNYIKLCIDRISDLAVTQSKVRNRTCAVAVWGIFSHKHYDHKRMEASFGNYSTKFFEPAPTESHYRVQFTEIYNYKRAKASHVLFYTDNDLKIVGKYRKGKS
jgi:hypothetical protein